MIDINLDELNLTNVEKDALKVYSFDSNSFNIPFRDNPMKLIDELENLIDNVSYERIRTLNSLMSGLKNEIVLYRGLKNFSTDDFKVGAVFHNIGGFQSSSSKISVARKYAGDNGIVLIIKAITGTKCLCMGKYSTNPYDEEFLLDYLYDYIPYKIDKETKDVYVNLKLKDIPEV
ncbi:MAG: hypothetical protein CfClM3_0464 [Methanobrevibacter sp. CfCl-M3]